MTTLVSAEIVTNDSEFPVERRFDVNQEIGKLKEKLEPITGANHQTMTVSLSVGGEEIGELKDSSKTLAEYLGEKLSIEKLKIKLTIKDDQSTSLFEGDVPKYEISEENYSQRSNNARNFINEMKKKNKTQA